MLPYLLLSLQALTVILGALALAWWLRRRLPVRWSTWGWGALSFAGSQAIRIPLLIGLTVMLKPLFAGADPSVLFWVNTAILAGTSGLFEETARYAVLRLGARDARRWDDAVMFGAGHGGCEAILIFGFTAISSIVLLAAGGQILAAVRTTHPEQATAVAAQIDALRNLQWWGTLAGIWERALAITLHIALSILVVRAVRERQLRWWAAAVVWHNLVNASGMITARYAGNVAAEGVLTLLTGISIAVILWGKHPKAGAAGAAIVPGPIDTALHRSPPIRG
jgi:uncharacterized membrane protein YhfC